MQKPNSPAGQQQFSKASHGASSPVPYLATSLEQMKTPLSGHGGSPSRLLEHAFPGAAAKMNNPKINVEMRIANFKSLVRVIQFVEDLNKETERRDN